MTTRRARAIALLITLLVVAAACGQKADVAQVGTGGGLAAGIGGEVIDPATGEVIPGGGEVIDPATGELIPASDTGGGTTGGGTTGGATGGATTGGTTGGGTPTAAGDRTGISDTEIRIGIHAPVTGAAPIPQNSFEEGKDVYWNFLKDKGGVFGRNVKVYFNDDKFDPRTAVQVCKKMVEQDKVFLLIGGGGADQITACANYAQSVGVPYLSAGVNEAGLAGIRAYFALSMSYSQQSPLLVQMTNKMFGKKKIGIAVADSQSFNDAQQSITKAFQAAGFEIVYNKRIPKSANAGDGASIANAMQTSGAEVVYFLSSPTTFITVASALNPTYSPQFIGPGITSGLNTVAVVGCNGRAGVNKAIFFSPFPQLDVIDKIDPDFQKAYNAQLKKDGDDLGLALWGLNKQLKFIFDAAGKDMTRESFVATVEGGKQFASGVFPPVQFSAKNHFGGTQVHVLQADCSSRSYKTIGTFVSGF